MAADGLPVPIRRRRIALDLRLVRFVLVGGINTAVDVAVYTLLVLTLVPVVPANLVSTSCGLVVSFVLNRRFVFRSAGVSGRGALIRQVAAFLLVTGTGLWVLQPLIIVSVTPLLQGMGVTGLLTVFVPKIAATCVTLVWNYCWYSMLVFSASRRTSIR